MILQTNIRSCSILTGYDPLGTERFHIGVTKTFILGQCHAVINGALTT